MTFLLQEPSSLWWGRLQRQPLPGCLGWGQKKVRESLLLRRHPLLPMSSIQEHTARQNTVLVSWTQTVPLQASVPLGCLPISVLSSLGSYYKKCCHEYLRAQVFSLLGRNVGIGLLSHMMLIYIFNWSKSFTVVFPIGSASLDISPTMFESAPGSHQTCPGNCQNL